MRCQGPWHLPWLGLLGWVRGCWMPSPQPELGEVHGQDRCAITSYQSKQRFFSVRRAPHPLSLITPVLWPRETWPGRAQAEKGRERIPAKVVAPKPRNLSRGQIRRPRSDKETYTWTKMPSFQGRKPASATCMRARVGSARRWVAKP